MSNSPETYYYGQGRVSLAIRDALTGVPGPFRWIGDVSAFSVKLTSTKVQHKESYSGQRGLARSFPIEKAASIDLTLHQLDSANLALTTYGTADDAAAGTVTAEEIPEGLVVGDDFYLKNPGVSDLVLTDSTGSPKTLVPGTDYAVADANFGRYTLLSVTGLVQPFKAAYSYAATKAVGMFTTGQPDIAMRYEGINLAEGNAPVLAEFYKVAPDVLQELQLITTGNDVAGLQITADLLIDPTKAPSSQFGQFGKITQIGLPA